MVIVVIDLCIYLIYESGEHRPVHGTGLSVVGRAPPAPDPWTPNQKLRTRSNSLKKRE